MMKRLLFLTAFCVLLNGCATASSDPRDYLPENNTGQLNVPYFPNYSPAGPFTIFNPNNYHPRYAEDDY